MTSFWAAGEMAGMWTQFSDSFKELCKRSEMLSLSKCKILDSKSLLDSRAVKQKLLSFSESWQSQAPVWARQMAIFSLIYSRHYKYSLSEN